MFWKCAYILKLHDYKIEWQFFIKLDDNFEISMQFWNYLRNFEIAQMYKLHRTYTPLNLIYHL